MFKGVPFDLGPLDFQKGGRRELVPLCWWRRKLGVLCSQEAWATVMMSYKARIFWWNLRNETTQLALLGYYH